MTDKQALKILKYNLRILPSEPLQSAKKDIMEALMIAAIEVLSRKIDNVKSTMFEDGLMDNDNLYDNR